MSRILRHQFLDKEDRVPPPPTTKEVKVRKINRMTDKSYQDLSNDLVDTIEKESASRVKTKRQKKRDKQLTKYVRIPPQIMSILEYWNSKPHLRHMKLPTVVKRGYYINVSKLIENTVDTIKGIFKQEFYQDLINKKIILPEEKPTIAQMKECIRLFNIMANDPSVFPRHKNYIQNLYMINFLYDPNGAVASYFLKILHDGLQYIIPRTISKNPFIAEQLLAKYNKNVYEGGEIDKNSQEYTRFLIGANKLKDFMDRYPITFQTISMLSYEKTWITHLFRSISWRKVKLKPLTLTQDWVYNDVLYDYLVHLGYSDALDQAYRSTEAYKEEEKKRSKAEFDEFVKEQEEEEKRQTIMNNGGYVKVHIEGY